MGQEKGNHKACEKRFFFEFLCEFAFFVVSLHYKNYREKKT